MDSRHSSRAAFIALSVALLFPPKNHAATQPAGFYPLCRVWFKTAGGAPLVRVQTVLGGLIPTTSSPVSFEEQKDGNQNFQIATIPHCDAALARRLQDGLSQGLATEKPTVEFKITTAAGPIADQQAPRRDIPKATIAERLARAYRIAYGTAYERSERTGLYGDYMIGAESARSVGYDPREVKADREVAARAGLDHFKNLMKRFQGDLRKTALAHCAGAGTVERGMAPPEQCRRFLAEFESGDAELLKDAPGARASLLPWRASSDKQAAIQQQQRATLRPWSAAPTGPRIPLPGPLGFLGEIGRQVFGFVGSVVLWPFDMAKNIISRFGDGRDGGRSHRGVDIGAAIGTPIVAPASGWIEGPAGCGGESRFGYCGISGYRLWIYHGKDQNGRSIETFYAHLHQSTPFAQGIRPGVHVQQGQVIAYVGMTGNARFLPVSASHLHFQVRIDGTDVDPERVFRSRLLVKSK